MATSLQFDPNLTPLLSSCTNEDLDPIVEYIRKAKTNELAADDAYNAHYGNHREYIGLVVSEIRTFGGNTIINTLRGGGVPYSEILGDVAKKLKVKRSPDASVEEIEIGVLTKILERSIEKMSPSERQTLEEEFRAAGAENVDLGAGIPLGAILGQVGVRMSGFLAYRVAAIVANAVAKMVLGRGLTMAGNATLMRLIGVMAGPVGWAITGLWTLVDIAGPAYRVTVPVVCHVAYLRQKKKFDALGQA